MSDPEVPVERGLRATVRMAAGINFGEARDTGVPARAGRWVRGLTAALWSRPMARIGEIVPAVDRGAGLLGSASPASLARHAGVGAAVGAAIVLVGFGVLAAQAALTASAAPPSELAAAAVEIAIKADRLPLPEKTAAIAASIEAPPAATADAGFATAATPPLAYASASAVDDAGQAINRVLETPAIAATTATAATVEEADDEAVVPVILPMPRPRPKVEVEILPMPRPRPVMLASLTPPTAADVARVPAEAAPPPGAIRPSPQSPNGLLGFFSSPTDPVRPPPKNKIDTPFGVPYVLQTGSVETACLKPELVELLRKIEGHYRQKVVITSGFRDRGRQGSLHRECAAADIEVPGVPAASLASFARTIPGIGGVGTYCHSLMIHVDTGTPRDWKYGCGSYFAMRGGQGKWGKVPASLAKAQGTGAPTTVVNDASEED